MGKQIYNSLKECCFECPYNNIKVYNETDSYNANKAHIYCDKSDVCKYYAGEDCKKIKIGEKQW